jgi:hypothetical protein
MTQLTSEDIWYICLAIGALLTMIPGGLLLSSSFTRRKDINPKDDKRNMTSFVMLLLMFSF